jgi:hypothetical protein
MWIRCRVPAAGLYPCGMWHAEEGALDALLPYSLPFPGTPSSPFLCHLCVHACERAWVSSFEREHYGVFILRSITFTPLSRLARACLVSCVLCVVQGATIRRGMPNAPYYVLYVSIIQYMHNTGVFFRGRAIFFGCPSRSSVVRAAHVVKDARHHAGSSPQHPHSHTRGSR